MTTTPTAIVFQCKLCGREHHALPAESNGVSRMPETITTDRDDHGAWRFRCASGCVEGVSSR
jgi:hypothetical protein